VIGICALCHSKAELRQSHIIPAFFGSYLKETSATGYLRSGETPNLRVQDLPKQNLLCDCCEGRFAVWEKAFREEVLPLVQSDGFEELKYGPSLLRFLVSLSWRILAVQQELLAKTHPQVSLAVSRTLENWRLFLLGKSKQPGSEHHMFVIAGVPVEMPPSSHEKMLHYLLRGIDAGTSGDSRTLFVYAKPLKSLIFSPVIPTLSKGWIGTRVHSGTGRLGPRQRIEMAGFLDFLNSRVTECHAKPLSENQRRKIGEAIVRQPERALASESYRVHRASKQLMVIRKADQELP
jgi:hypothetical protein